MIESMGWSVKLFRFDAFTELGTFMRTEFLCISVLGVASGPRVKLASCKSAAFYSPTGFGKCLFATAFLTCRQNCK